MAKANPRKPKPKDKTTKLVGDWLDHLLPTVAMLLSIGCKLVCLYSIVLAAVNIFWRIK